MSKNIVVCLDGTGNQFNGNNTNVIKLFQVIVRDESQLAYYDPGVGTLADPDYKTPYAKRFQQILGLAFGKGILTNVGNAYSYLMDYYEPGDNLFFFGFSRGAYAARVLAGFIHSVGLLEPGCQNLIPYAMKLYSSKNIDFAILQKFKNTYGRDIDVQFLGLWDSVSTFGWIYNPTFLPFTTNNKSVLAVRHAMAIDERRSFFSNMHWGTKHRNTQDVKEVWFAGVHADVGGGYPEAQSGLSKIPLQWMLDEASESELELAIDAKKHERYVEGLDGGGYVGPDPLAQAHDSLKGVWHAAQRLPRSVWLVDEERQAIRWPKSHRFIKLGSRLHRSVIDRITDIEYSPPSLYGKSVRELSSEYSIED